MSEQVAKSFTDALGRLEERQDLEPIVGTFAKSAKIGIVLVPDEYDGPEGAREFWTHYRKAFGQMKSTFRNVIAADGRAALEWTTEGTSPSGHQLRYDGVSVLEIEGDKITRFVAYFDPAKLGRQMTD